MPFHLHTCVSKSLRMKKKQHHAPDGVVVSKGMSSTQWVPKTTCQVFRAPLYGEIHRGPVSSPSRQSLTYPDSVQDAKDDFQDTRNKRQKVSDYRYRPQSAQRSSNNQSFRKPPGTMPPPGPSINQGPSFRRKKPQPISTPNQRGSLDSALANRESGLNQGVAAEDAQRQIVQAWSHAAADAQSDFRSDDLPYMSGALQSEDPALTRTLAESRQANQRKKKIQPVDDLHDMSKFNFGVSGQPLMNKTPRTQYGPDKSGDHEIFRESQIVKNLCPARNHYPSISKAIPIDYDQPPPPRQYQTEHFSSQQPYCELPTRQNAYRLTRPQPNRPHTPSPQRLDALRQSDNFSITSPFFGGRQPHVRSSRHRDAYPPRALQQAQDITPNFRMAPPQRSAQRAPMSQAQTMNGLSFVANPYLVSDHAPSHDFEMGIEHRGQESMSRVPRDPNGLFIRPDVHQGSVSAPSPRYEMMHSVRHSGRPQPLPSSKPSLASSINMTHTKRRPTYDSALANVRGVKGASTFSSGTSSGLFGSRSGMFSGSGRRSVRR